MYTLFLLLVLFMECRANCTGIDAANGCYCAFEENKRPYDGRVYETPEEGIFKNVAQSRKTCFNWCEYYANGELKVHLKDGTKENVVVPNGKFCCEYNSKLPKCSIHFGDDIKAVPVPVPDENTNMDGCCAYEGIRDSLTNCTDKDGKGCHCAFEEYKSTMEDRDYETSAGKTFKNAARDRETCFKWCEYYANGELMVHPTNGTKMENVIVPHRKSCCEYNSESMECSIYFGKNVKAVPGPD